MRCAILLAEGFETVEALLPLDLLRRAKVHVDLISINQDYSIRSSHKVLIETDYAWKDVDLDLYDALILPGGRDGKNNLENSEAVKETILRFAKEEKWIASICAAPSILGHLGLLKGKKYTCNPSFEEEAFEGTYVDQKVVVDGKIITGRAMSSSMEFARTMVSLWSDEETMKRVDEGMHYEDILEGKGVIYE